MTGTEKILRHITEQAQAQAKEILAEADQKIEELRKKTLEEAASIGREGQKAADAYIQEQAGRTESNLAMRKRQAILQTKGALVQEALDQAQDALLSLDDNAYFAFLLRLLEKQEDLHAGELCLNAKDLARRPADFEKKIAAIAEEKGVSLTLSDQPANIGGGFLLNYGGSLENCSVEAILESEEDALKDRIRAVLFTEDGSV
ncbi:MAG: V-type ATP synthase subunit E [Lachnospiraceae bacterium]|nr:V-type ATP synthase subunit E [Lachnospiraceae bacterium]